jgi:TAG lipase/steryl ester hydrolase/phospholipase A2/LPA acyltransferase
MALKDAWKIEFGVIWVLLLAAFVVTFSLIQSLLRKWQERFDERLKAIRHTQERMKAANSYQEWREFAQQLDRLGHARGGGSSGRIKENLYDRRLLQQKLSHLQKVREHGSVKEMMFALRSDLIRNIANIAKRWVFALAHVDQSVNVYGANS